MLITLNEVVKRTQVVLDDPTGSQFSSDYLTGIINQRYDDLIVELTQLELTYEEVVTVINPFAANTVDLSTLEADGGALQAMFIPVSLEWKFVGDDDTQYRPVERVDKVEDVPAATQGISSYEWRGGTVVVSPSSVDVVLRVRYQAMSTNLVDPTDKTIRGVTNILAYKTGELASALRGGDNGTKLALRLQGMGDRALDNFEVMAIKNQQGTTRRLGANRARRGIIPFVAR